LMSLATGGSDVPMATSTGVATNTGGGSSNAASPLVTLMPPGV
jgi:hypothetical protein